MGEGALQFARERGLPLEDDAYFYDAYRYQQWEEA